MTKLIHEPTKGLDYEKTTCISQRNSITAEFEFSYISRNIESINMEGLCTSQTGQRF